MSTVIKAGQDFKLVKQLTTIDLADHLAEADKIVAEARRQAQAITTQAKHDAHVALQDAKEKGYAVGNEKGHQEGFEAGKTRGWAEARERFTREQATLCSAFGAALTDLNARKRDLMIEARHDTLEFAVALACRAARRIGELNRSAAAANLEEALRLVSNKTDVTVRVNSIDVETMRRFADDLVARAGGCEHVRVIEDDSVIPGGCVVTTGGSEIDAGIDTQMNEIVRLLLGEVPQG